MRSTTRFLRPALASTAVVIGVDQGTKALSPHGAGLGAIDPTTNPEFAIGIAQLDLPIMIALSGLGILAAGVWAVHRTMNGRLHWSIPALLLGGAISNLIDRVAFGAVRDFVVLPLIVANVADLAIVAAFLTLALTRRTSRRQTSESPRAGEASVAAHASAPPIQGLEWDFASENALAPVLRSRSGSTRPKGGE